MIFVLVDISMRLVRFRQNLSNHWSRAVQQF